MAELTEATKMEIVTRLARYEKPAAIVRALGKEGIELEVRQVGAYDPTRAYYDAGDKWLAIFEAVRREYTEDLAKIPGANQAFRMNRLHRLLEWAEDNNKVALAASLIEQMSKEVGGVFTNARDVTINDNRKPLAQLTPEERREMLLGQLDDAIAARNAAAAGETLQ